MCKNNYITEFVMFMNLEYYPWCKLQIIQPHVFSHSSFLLLSFLLLVFEFTYANVSFFISNPAINTMSPSPQDHKAQFSQTA